MPAISSSGHLPDIAHRIKSGSHWRVVIHPSTFEHERIATLNDCWQLAEKCSVQFRGWDFPHVDSRNREIGSDWIVSWSDFDAHLEYWRLYQSSQFVHLVSLREDHPRIRAELEKTARFSILNLRDGSIKPSGYLEVNFTIFTLTEIFEFASRLATRGILGDSASIRVELHGAKGRALCVSDLRKAWWNLYQANEDLLAKEWTCDSTDLAARPAELSRQACLWFFERFHWLNPPIQVIEAEQDKLIHGRL